MYNEEFREKIVRLHSQEGRTYKNLVAECFLQSRSLSFFQRLHDTFSETLFLGCVGKIEQTKKHKQFSDKISLKVEECLCQTYFIT